MIIKRITVGNFKNLAETTLDLTSMIALVSTNNYGKSNLLTAIRFGFDFISASAKDREAMMCWRRGIPLTPALTDKEYVFSVEFDDPRLNEYRYVRYGFKFSWFNDQKTGARITDETIEMRANESVRYTSYLKRERGQYRAGKQLTGFRNITLAKNMLAIDVLSAVDSIDIADVIAAIKELNYQMCDTLKLKQSFTPNPIEFDLDESSSRSFDDDIPRALSVLKRDHPDKYDLFIETVYDLFPEFSRIDLTTYTLKRTEPAPPQTAVMLTEGDESTQNIPFHVRDEIHKLIIYSKYINQPISMENMSTGTKRIFWLIANAVFGGCDRINLLCVDEIETSIHPKMIEKLLESLVDILEDSSLIITSHSPYIIQYLKPEFLYIGVPNEHGIAQFRRIQKSKVKPLLTATRNMETSIGEYLFELMSGDVDSSDILAAYLEEA